MKLSGEFQSEQRSNFENILNVCFSPHRPCCEWNASVIDVDHAQHIGCICTVSMLASGGTLYHGHRPLATTFWATTNWLVAMGCFPSDSLVIFLFVLCITKQLVAMGCFPSDSLDIFFICTMYYQASSMHRARCRTNLLERFAIRKLQRWDWSLLSSLTMPKWNSSWRSEECVKLYICWTMWDNNRNIKRCERIYALLWITEWPVALACIVSASVVITAVIFICR